MFPFFLLGFAAIAILLGARWFAKQRSPVAAASVPAGYVTDEGAFTKEYARYYGFEPESGVKGQFQSAANLSARHNIPGAASVLEAVTKAGGVPVLFHDLGVTYMLLADYRRAGDAFREALARDPEYAPTRKYLRGAKNIPPGAAEPYTREQEPNNDTTAANLIGLRAPVGGEVGGNDSADYFRVIAPGAPRDLITVELTKHSLNFPARVHVYDSKQRIESWNEKAAGDTITLSGAPPPNSTVYISITGAEQSGGLYLLRVTPQKAFDRYEPDDDIMAAHRISIGEEISANVMDGEDTDFYSFVSPRKGTISIELRNGSTEFLPVVATYNGDRRNMGFAPEIRKPGTGIRHTINVEKDQIYYLQISSQDGTSGAYSLRID